MNAVIKNSEDHRTLVAVTFRRRSEEGEGPELEVIYHLHWPNDFTLTSNPIVLTPLSVTRTDTRQGVELTVLERAETMNAAVVAADRFDRTLYEG
jgi:hypothetical protein